MGLRKTKRTAGKGRWLRALLLLLAVLALAPPVSAAPGKTHPVARMAAVADCAGHDEPRPGPRHADQCCAFHCAPAVPLVALDPGAPLSAGFRFARPVDDGLREFTPRLPLPPPRAA
ncbi:hypothetical protein [Aureimonas sp. AU4]|uniref:hypothetical protein n=1 Tax=Aureimonas sp. AU4 TaxID=1638163 RepID=UPI00078124C2|nr:hypothetical protein [Aureimonas sp. AU4]